MNCIVLTTRGNYAKFRKLLSLGEFQTVVGGELVNQDRVTSFFNVPATRKVYFNVAGDTSGAMARSTGLAVAEFTAAFEDLCPSRVLLVGDRFETFAAAQAAYLCGIPIAHLEGGEISGTLDNKIRDAISNLSTIHFPCTERAGERLKTMGLGSVHVVGCTSLDDFPTDFYGHFDGIQKLSGSGELINFEKPFLLAVYHPDTAHPGKVAGEIDAVIEAVRKLDMPTVWVNANLDAGSGIVGAALRRSNLKAHFFKSLPIHLYGPLLANAACIVGNSSSGIREGSFLGTPNVTVGERQRGREAGENTVYADCSDLFERISYQLHHGRYEPSTLYGDGKASERILCTLA